MSNQALALAERLRCYGYTVETVAPGDMPQGPADLEVTLKSGRASELLKEIAAQTVSGSPDVYIAAGTLRSTPLPAAATRSPVHPELPTIADTMNGVAAGLQNKRDLLAKALREQRTLLRQARIAERQRVRHSGAIIPVAPSRPEEQIVAPVEQPAAAFPAPLAEISNTDSSPKFEVPGVLMEDEGCADFLQQEPELLRQDGIQPRYEQDVPQEPVPIAVPPEVAAAPDRYTPAGETFQDSHVASTPRRRAVRVVIPGGRRLSRRAREWRAAVLISSLFAGVLILLWAAVTREPVSPLPSSLSAQTGVEESVPFGAVTLKPTASAAPPPSRAHPPAMRPTPVAITASKQTGHAAVSSQKKVSHKNERRRRSARRSSENDIAEDQVIYHRSSPNPQAGGNEKASLKKFSD